MNADASISRNLSKDIVNSKYCPLLRIYATPAIRPNPLYL